MSLATPAADTLCTQDSDPSTKLNDITSSARTSTDGDNVVEPSKLTSYQCRLLQLPRELRDMIYDVCLTADTPITIRGNTATCKSGIPSAAIIRTCAQIHAEAADMLFTKNVFSISFDCDSDRGGTTILRNVARVEHLYRLQAVSFQNRAFQINEQNLSQSCFPVHKIRRLGLRLVAPSSGWTPPVRRHLNRYNYRFNAVMIASVLQVCLAGCVERMVSLTKMRIVSSGWHNVRGRFFLTDVLTRIHEPKFCRGEIELVQDCEETDFGAEVAHAMKMWREDFASAVERQKKDDRILEAWQALMTSKL